MYLTSLYNTPYVYYIFLILYLLILTVNVQYILLLYKMNSEKFINTDADFEEINFDKLLKIQSSPHISLQDSIVDKGRIS